MAHRRFGREHVTSIILDDSETENVADTPKPNESLRSTLRISKPHPALTDFGLDTLSIFLQQRLEDKTKRDQLLKNDPWLAAAEAEKDKLRQLVNSNRLIDAKARNGRLEVRPQAITPRRRHSAPASEGDNESTQRRSRSFSTSANSKDISKHKKKPWALRKRMPHSMHNAQDRDLVRTSSWASATSEVLRHTANDGNNVAHVPSGEGRHPEIDMSEFEWSSSAPTSVSTGIFRRRAASIPPPAPHRQQSHKTTKLDRTSTGTSSASTSVSAVNVCRPSVVDQRQESTEETMPPNRLQDTSTDTKSPNSRMADPVRSLCFERHADEARKSMRVSKDVSKSPPSAYDDNSSLLGLGVPRFRKTTASSNTSQPDPAAPASQLSVLSRANALHISDQSDQSLTAQTSASSSRSSVPTSEDDRLSDTEHTISASKPGQQVKGIADQYDNLDQSIVEIAPAPATRHIRDLSVSRSSQVTGRDTSFFISGDNMSSSEADEDTRVDQIGKSDENVSTTIEDNSVVRSKRAATFDYRTVVAESLPPDINQARENYRKVWSSVGLDDRGQPDLEKSNLWYTTQFTNDELNPDCQNVLGAPNEFGQYPRVWKAQVLPCSTRDLSSRSPTSWRKEFPEEILPTVCNYLSSQDVRNLRLVNRVTASAILPLMIRSTVVRFGKPLFDATSGQSWDDRSNLSAENSLLQNYGSQINKFGISFDVDTVGLANAKLKTIEAEVDAWFGKYTWPKETYPRFPQLKELEDLVDSNRPLLKNTMRNLTHVSELALSIDSGHGWLNGPDISDLALFKKRNEGGSPLFGKAFTTPDVWEEFSLRQFFRWGQENTINTCAKRLASTKGRGGFGGSRMDRKQVRRFRVRDYDEYRIQGIQPDFNKAAHTGGTTPNSAPQPAVHPVQPGAFAGGLNHLATQFHATHPNAVQAAVPNVMNHAQQTALMTAIGMNGSVNPNNVPAPTPMIFPQQPTQQPTTHLVGPAQAALHRRNAVRMREHRRAAREDEESRAPIIPQWPLLFNCHNLAAQMGGNYPFIQNEVSSPTDFAYLPGELTETQVQWLMETLWAQRAFLSAYTNSIITNAGCFKDVHSLHVTKLSSGLIHSIAQDEFWSSLPSLKNLTLKISPDWRHEHVPGDKFFYRNMSISPTHASLKLAYLLENFISKLENLSSLKTGFVGGGEHQTGIFGRNRHVLPAPVTSDPQAWLTDHENKPASDTLFVFNHIRNLTFENCWFSSCMLEAFMRKSRDTSLHHLTLDSVSLTGIHDTRNDEPLTTESHNLKCDYSPSEWLHEKIPRNACWVNILDNITPGKTILDRKYEAEMIDVEDMPRPEPIFRGNVKKITLNSCGYVQISGVRSEQFSQSGLVKQSKLWYAVDAGLEARRHSFYKAKASEAQSSVPDADRGRLIYPRRDWTDGPTEPSKVCIMMSSRDPENRGEYFGLGKLTQCVHPIEKRVLERAWGMSFGWGDTMERWAAVEDGWYEGGTGRFSGTIEREDNE